MKETTINGHRVKYFDSIEDCTAERFQAYNVAALIDSGIGGDVESVDRKIGTIARLVGKSDDTSRKQLKTTLQNLQQNLHFVIERMNPEMKSFAALVYSIDGELCEDFSDEGLKYVMNRLKKVKVGAIRRLINDVKKNFEFEFETYFPESTPPRLKEFFDFLKKRNTLILNDIIRGTNSADDLEKINNEMFRLNPPTNFHGTGGAEVRIKTTFEDNCLIISENGLNPNPKKMTVFAFNRALQMLKKKYKKNKNAKQ